MKFTTPLNPDTDNDSLSDSFELNLYETGKNLGENKLMSPLNSTDIYGDFDKDTLSNIEEYQRDPSGDYDGDGTPISEMRHVTPSELDPLIPYANSTGVWTDTDSDGIPDAVEAMLSNTSYWQFLVVEYPLLWAHYAWAAKYYDTIKKKENETAAKEWLHDQFNPLIVDHTPPVVTKFTLRWEVRTTTSPPFVAVYAVVHVAVRDVGGIYSLNIYDLDSGEEYEPNKLGYTHYDLEHKFSASLLQAGVGSVTIRVYAEDYAGNSIQVQKNLSGAFGVVLNVLSALWSQFWDALVEVGKAMAKAVDVIVEWVKEIINNILSIFGKIMNVVEGFGNRLLTLFLQSYENYKQTGKLGPEVQEINNILDTLAVIITTSFGVMIGLMMIFDVVSLGIGNLIIGLASGLILSFVMNYIVGTIIGKEIAIPGPPLSLTPLWIIDVIKQIFGMRATLSRGMDSLIIMDYILHFLSIGSSLYTLYVISQIDFTGLAGMSMAGLASIAGIAMGGVVVPILHTMPPDTRTFISFIEAIFGIFALLGIGLMGKPAKGYWMSSGMKILNIVCTLITAFNVGYAFYMFLG